MWLALSLMAHGAERQVLVGLTPAVARTRVNGADLSLGAKVGWRPLARFTTELEATGLRGTAPQGGTWANAGERRGEGTLTAIYSPLVGELGWDDPQVEGVDMALDVGLGAGAIVFWRPLSQVLELKPAVAVVLGPRFTFGRLELRLQGRASLWSERRPTLDPDVPVTQNRIGQRVDLGAAAAYRFGRGTSG